MTTSGKIVAHGKLPAPKLWGPTFFALPCTIRPRRWRILIGSGPKVVSAHQRYNKKAADFDLVWSLQFQKTGIGFAALRVVNRAALQASVTFLRKARYEDKPDDRTAAFLWIRIVNISPFFPLSRLRYAQTDDPGTKLPSLANISNVASPPFHNPIGEAGSVA